jgi:hypothetical protein
MDHGGAAAEWTDADEAWVETGEVASGGAADIE